MNKLHNTCLFCRKYNSIRPCSKCTGWVENRQDPIIRKVKKENEHNN